MKLYPVPPLPEPSTSLLPNLDHDHEPIYENLASITDLVKEMSSSQQSSDVDEGIEVQNETPMQSETPEIIEEKLLGAPAQTEQDAKPTKVVNEFEEPLEMLPQGQMSFMQLLAILLIFCLIILVLNIMWNNLFTTLFVTGLALPILRWLGKV